MKARPILGEEFQHVAHEAQCAVFETLNALVISMCEFSGEAAVDGGPVVMGAFGGLLEFALKHGSTPDQLRDLLTKQFEIVLPQMVMAMAGPGGNA